MKTVEMLSLYESNKIEIKKIVHQMNLSNSAVIAETIETITDDLKRTPVDVKKAIEYIVDFSQFGLIMSDNYRNYAREMDKLSGNEDHEYEKAAYIQVKTMIVSKFGLNDQEIKLLIDRLAIEQTSVDCDRLAEYLTSAWEAASWMIDQVLEASKMIDLIHAEQNSNLIKH